MRASETSASGDDVVKRRDVLTFLLAGAVVLGVGGRGGSGLSELADPLSAIEAVAANVETAATGAHLGFDTSKYPGDDAMQAWRNDGSYEWVGYYLPAGPRHRDASWSGKREQLTQMGWGLRRGFVRAQKGGEEA